MNLEATQKARKVLNVIAPRMNEELAGAGVEIDLRSSMIREHLPEKERKNFDTMIRDLRKHMAAIGTGIKGLVGLFKVMHAQHNDEKEIDQIGGEFVANVTNLEKTDTNEGREK